MSLQANGCVAELESATDWHVKGTRNEGEDRASRTSQESGRANKPPAGLEAGGKADGEKGTPASRVNGGASSSIARLTRASVFGEGVPGSDDTVELVSRGGGCTGGGGGTSVEIGGGRSPEALGARASTGDDVARGRATPPVG